MLAELEVDVPLTAIALGYHNREHIADLVLPRVGVPTMEFRYTEYAFGQNMAMVDTRIDRRSKPYEVDFVGKERSSFVEDHGLDAPIPNRDKNVYAAAPDLRVNIEAQKILQLTGIIEAKREKRAADLVFSAASYPVTNVETLSGTDQWSDYANSTPVDDVQKSLDTLYIRPNRVVMGERVWFALRRHPQISAALFPNGYNISLGAPIASREAVAELLGVSEIIIGRSYLNTSAPGQAPSMSRVWGNDCLFFYQDQNITSPEGTVTLGCTAQWEGRISGRIADPDMGLRGGYRVRVGESVREILLAPECGYLFKNAVSAA